MLDRTPKVFISYSWTSKEYQEKIIELASRRHGPCTFNVPLRKNAIGVKTL